MPLTYISRSTDFGKIYVESRKVQFSVAVIAVSMKPCIVIVLDTLLAYISHSNDSIFYVESRIEVHFSAAVIAVNIV